MAATTFFSASSAGKPDHSAEQKAATAFLQQAKTAYLQSILDAAAEQQTLTPSLSR